MFKLKTEVKDYLHKAKELMQIRAGGNEASCTRSSPNILLTGITGFIGGNLFIKLLKKYPESSIFCIIRKNDKHDYFKQIKKNYNEADQEYLAKEKLRIRFIPCVYRESQWGLSNHTINRLSIDADIIYHAGCKTSFVMSYEIGKPAIVDSFMLLLKIATSDHVKPIIYTGSCIDNICESYSGTEDSGLYKGYCQGKYVVNEVIKYCRKQFNYPIQDFDLGYVTAFDQVPFGYADSLEGLFKIVLDTGFCPELSLHFDYVDIEDVTRSMIKYGDLLMKEHNSSEEYTKNISYGAYRKQTFTWNDFVTIAKKIKPDLKMVTLTEFVDFSQSYISEHPRLQYIVSLLTPEFEKHMNLMYEHVLKNNLDYELTIDQLDYIIHFVNSCFDF